MYYVLAMGVPAAAAKHQINPSPFCVSRLLLLLLLPPEIKEMRVYISTRPVVYLFALDVQSFHWFPSRHIEQLSFPSF
jgi:hypothetical protein